jgi:hypothetical protein
MMRTLHCALIHDILPSCETRMTQESASESGADTDQSVTDTDGPNKEPPRQCINGHVVSENDRICQKCGVVLKRENREGARPPRPVVGRSRVRRFAGAIARWFAGCLALGSAAGFAASGFHPWVTGLTFEKSLGVWCLIVVLASAAASFLTAVRVVSQKLSFVAVVTMWLLVILEALIAIILRRRAVSFAHSLIHPLRSINSGSGFYFALAGAIAIAAATLLMQIAVIIRD